MLVNILPYYICDYYVTYTSSAPTGVVPTGTCGAPELFVDSTTNTEVTTHEFRINADINDNVDFSAGVFL